jgi:hypothetical protein
MVVCQLSGGLGNQLYQHALARRLAGSQTQEVLWDLYPLQVYLIPPRRLTLERFHSRGRVASWTDIWRLCPQEGAVRMLRRCLPVEGWKRLLGRLQEIGWGSPCRFRFYEYVPAAPMPPLKLGRVVSERHFHFDPEVLALSGDLLLTGYWQTEKYFADAAPQLRKEFQVKKPQEGRNLAIAGRMQVCQSVSLHVRRGDKVTAKDFNPTTYEFCIRAMTWFRQQLTRPVFFIFTDDWDWVRQNLPAGPEVVHVDHNDEKADYEDLRLMTQCRHHIIAPSSFSWWGAWLNPNPDKMVLSPPHQRWLNFRNCDTSDVIPPSWVQMDDR